MCFLSFSSKKHAESFINFVKNQVLDPKRAKFDEKSEIGHVRPCPGGPIWAHKGPIWAHKGRYGPCGALVSGCDPTQFCPLSMCINLFLFKTALLLNPGLSPQVQKECKQILRCQCKLNDSRARPRTRTQDRSNNQQTTDKPSEPKPCGTPYKNKGFQKLPPPF